MTAFRVETGKCEMCGTSEQLWRLGSSKVTDTPNPPAHSYGAPFYTFCESCWEDGCDEPCPDCKGQDSFSCHTCFGAGIVG